MIKQLIANIVLNLTNWKTDTIPPDNVRGTILIAAPHTSNWDLVYAIASFWKHNGKIKFLIKENYTKNLLYGWFIRWLGGIGVNRTQKNDLINYCSELLKNDSELLLMVPVEGSRKWTSKWKLGFYYIALKANVPISLGYLDYEKKVAGVGKLVYPNKKSKEELFREIEEFYKDKVAKYPENFNPKIY